MPPAIDTVTATVTAAAAGRFSAAAVAGDSLIVRSTASRVRLLNCGSTRTLSLRAGPSPKLHDTRAACDCAHKFISLSRFYVGSDAGLVSWTRSPRPSLPPPAQEKSTPHADGLLRRHRRHPAVAYRRADFTEAQTGNRHGRIRSGAPASARLLGDRRHHGAVRPPKAWQLLRACGLPSLSEPHHAHDRGADSATSASRCQARHLSKTAAALSSTTWRATTACR